ncbi:MULTISPECIES: SMI1/KNR4 family protein [Bacillaceae]|uniref:SMI1/KNR4 family protein n=1 Tax=Bacillaceae TaxID=186817 RepID=UPI001E3E7ABA|nr:SMI1/KNR4 family protein [Bacillus sp. Au-Bac7]MCE4051399.1 SMI1/KNR4 family protein [Bacillus sp. Au-Bac7]
MSEENMEEYFNINIKSILKALTETKNTEIYYYGSKVEYGFNFKKGATDKEISYLENKIGYKLPNDYKEFLQYTNGLKFRHYDAKISDIEDMLESYEIFDYPDYMVVIGTSLSSQLQIAINLLTNEDDNRIYVVDPIADDYFVSINSNFTEFLNRFLSSYGSDYWNWGIDSTNKILKNTE